MNTHHYLNDHRLHYCFYISPNIYNLRSSDYVHPFINNMYKEKVCLYNTILNGANS